MNEEGIKERIRDLVAADRLEEAIKLLRTYYRNSKEVDTILIHQARYNSLVQNKLKGGISEAQINNEVNSLRANLLSFVRHTNSDPNSNNNTSAATSLKNFKESLRYARTKVAVAKVFLEHFKSNQALTISLLVEKSNVTSRKLVFDFITELENNDLVDKIKIGGRTKWILTQNGKTVLENI